MNASVQTAALCELLPWDSGFFHWPIARVLGETLDEGQAEQIEQWCQAEGIHTLYFLARPDCPVTLRAAERHGFRLVDIRATYEQRFQGRAETAAHRPLADAVIRPFQHSDLKGLQAIAQDAHGDTRFFSDPCFPRALAKKLYSTWITLECQGRAQRVLVAVAHSDAPLGYISCHLDSAHQAGQIGLAGVSRQAQGKGLGKALVLGALDWFASHGTQTVTVVTQGKNAPAQRLYQCCGFRTAQVQLWYHKWYPSSLPDDA